VGAQNAQARSHRRAHLLSPTQMGRWLQFTGRGYPDGGQRSVKNTGTHVTRRHRSGDRVCRPCTFSTLRPHCGRSVRRHHLKHVADLQALRRGTTNDGRRSATASLTGLCGLFGRVGTFGRESSFMRGALDLFYLFAGSHPELARFGMGVALSRAEVASGSFCWANSFLNAATLCSASASVAAVPRTCAMSSFKAVLSISIPRLARATTTVAPKIA
jgi:hypothetical protein